jgi:hypothetical protein
MNQRSAVRQVASAVVISVIVVLVLFGAIYYAYRADGALGHGPLPSSASSSTAYAITLVVAFFAVLSAVVAYVGVTQTRGLTGRFYWLPYILVGVLLLLVLLLPLHRFGSESFIGVPDFLVSVPAQVLAGVALGFLVLNNLGANFVPVGWRGQSTGATASASVKVPIRGLPGRFTPSAWRVLGYMQEEAKRFEHGFMGTEHLLLGMIRERQSLAGRTMVNLSIDLDDIRTQVEGIIGRRGSLYTGAVGLTRRCRQVIEQAARLARESGRRTVGSGHLLQSLMTDPHDAAGQLLESIGVTDKRVADELRHLGYETEETETAATTS